MISPRIISGLITFAVITLLIIAGPAEAFVLDISMSDDKPTEGEIVKFDVSAKIEPSDSISNISYFLLEIEKEGSNDVISCKFLPDGTKLTACLNIINITKKSSAPFGYGYSYGYSYGYGFGEGIFSFEISLDTEGLDHGAYRTRFIAEVEGDVIEKEGKKLIISERKKDKKKAAPSESAPQKPTKKNFKPAQALWR